MSQVGTGSPEVYGKDGSSYNIFEAGDGVKIIQMPWVEAKTVMHEAYVDGVPIDTHGMDLDRESAMKLASGDEPDANIDTAPTNPSPAGDEPDANIKPASTEHVLGVFGTDCEPSPPVDTASVGRMPPDTRHWDVCKRVIVPNHRIYRGKPPPVLM